VNLNGRFLGLVVGEDKRSWHLDDGKAVRKAAEGHKWQWVITCDTTCDGSTSPERSKEHMAATDSDTAAEDLSLPSTANLAIPDWVVVAVSNYLPLRYALRLTMSCQTWSSMLQGHIPLALPPSQTDALLVWSLLQVLVCFDDVRLPLPMSAVFGEMRMAARRASLDVATCKHLEGLFQTDRPHHVCWEADIKQSGYKTLDRFAKHFDSKKLIETLRQRWSKKIHHSPNIRTCVELMLTKVNRNHPLFLEHERSMLKMAEPGAPVAGAVGGTAGLAIIGE